MSRRRIWIAEGFASDGDVYGRSLRLPHHMSNATLSDEADVQKKAQAAVIKSNLGDIPSCPCLSAILPQDD